MQFIVTRFNIYIYIYVCIIIFGQLKVLLNLVSEYIIEFYDSYYFTLNPESNLSLTDHHVAPF